MPTLTRQFRDGKPIMRDGVPTSDCDECCDEVNCYFCDGVGELAEQQIVQWQPINEDNGGGEGFPWNVETYRQSGILTYFDDGLGDTGWRGTVTLGLLTYTVTWRCGGSVFTVQWEEPTTPTDEFRSGLNGQTYFTTAEGGDCEAVAESGSVTNVILEQGPYILEVGEMATYGTFTFGWWQFIPTDGLARIPFLCPSTRTKFPRRLFYTVTGGITASGSLFYQPDAGGGSWNVAFGNVGIAILPQVRLNIFWQGPPEGDMTVDFLYADGITVNASFDVVTITSCDPLLIEVTVPNSINAPDGPFTISITE